MSQLIYAPYSWTAEDWGITEFSNESFSKIICVPVFFNQPEAFCYRDELKDLDLSYYDLVILSDIEYECVSKIKQWIEKNNIKKYLLSVGGITKPNDFDSACMIYRPWWCYNLLKHNQWVDTHATQKEYWFDALLGARRPHRDYIMLAMDHYGLLEKSIVTYRDAFHTGQVINNQTQEFSEIYAHCELKYPYVSKNLLPEWEVVDTVEKSISRLVPWQIYQHTWFSVVAETLGTGDTFFLSEKTTKALYAERIFVVFSNAFFLQNLQQLGFETFGDVIDETYDSNLLDFDRFRQVAEQMKYLSEQNPVLLYQKVLPRLKHNHHRLYELQKETRQKQHLLLQNVFADDVIC